MVSNILPYAQYRANTTQSATNLQLTRDTVGPITLLHQRGSVVLPQRFRRRAWPSPTVKLDDQPLVAHDRDLRPLGQPNQPRRQRLDVDVEYAGTAAACSPAAAMTNGVLARDYELDGFELAVLAARLSPWPIPP